MDEEVASIQNLSRYKIKQKEKITKKQKGKRGEGKERIRQKPCEDK